MARASGTTTTFLASRAHTCCPADVALRHRDLVVTDAEGGALHDLLQRCPYTLWVERSGRRIQRVLAAVDPFATNLASTVLSHSMELAEDAQAELFAMHAWDAPGESLLAHYESVHRACAYVQAERECARRAFDAVLDEREPVLDRAHRVFLRGRADIVIPHVANDLDADAVVIGLTPRPWLTRVMFGHTAAHVAPRLDCHLVVVKAPEEGLARAPLPRAIVLRGAA